MINTKKWRMFATSLVLCFWNCVSTSQFEQLYGEVIAIRTKLDELGRETDMALASATCSKDVIELMQSVAKFCTDKCTVNKLDIAISKVANDANFINLMKAQPGVAFYWSNPWGNASHIDRLQKIIRKRRLPRTKLLIVANTTPRKTKPTSATQEHDEPLTAEQDAALTRANETVEKLKEESAKLAQAESGVLGIREEDIIVWLVPYLRSEESIRNIPPDGRPPFGYPISQGKPGTFSPKDTTIKQEMIYRSVWVYLINCWPRNPDCKVACEKVNACGLKSMNISCEANCGNPDDQCAICLNETSCEEIKAGKCISSCPSELPK